MPLETIHPMGLADLFRLPRQKGPLRLNLLPVRVPPVGQPMKIFLTAKVSNRADMPALARWLEGQGHKVVSTWFERDASKFPHELKLSAAIDRVELDDANALVVYTGIVGTVAVSSCVEFGYCLCANKPIYYIGNPVLDVYFERYSKRWPEPLPAGVIG